MNFMGMGVMELGVIFLVAFLVMGPSKSIEMAKTTGRVIRDIRKVFNEIASSVDLTGTATPPANTPTAPTNAPPENPSGSLPQQPPQQPLESPTGSLPQQPSQPGETHEST